MGKRPKTVDCPLDGGKQPKEESAKATFGKNRSNTKKTVQVGKWEFPHQQARKKLLTKKIFFNRRPPCAEQVLPRGKGFLLKDNEQALMRGGDKSLKEKAKENKKKNKAVTKGSAH